jgi:hypothetical protein
MQAGCMAFSLATNPAVREKAKAEIDANLGDGTPTFADMKKLPYTFAVLKESLRCADPSEPLKFCPSGVAKISQRLVQKVPHAL